jgi:YidC/Oxa1 family membrane protein insertase
MKYAYFMQMKEKRIQDKLKPQLDKIRAESAGAERHRRTSELYKRYSYHPIYSMRSLLGLLIQIPFLMAAYHALKNNGALHGQSFLIVPDLGRPDAMIFGINFLPVLMTFVNMLSACVTPGFERKNIVQAWIVSLIFLLILYTSPSALLIFWTCNNLWGLLLNMRSYWTQEKKNPIITMFRTFLSTIRSIPTPMFEPGSRFNRVSLLVVFLLELHAMTSAYLNVLDAAQTTIAALTGICIIAFQILFSAERLRSALRYIAWLFALTLGAFYYSFLWKDALSIGEPLLTAKNLITHAIGDNSGRFLAAGVAILLCQIGLFLFTARHNAQETIVGGPRSKWDYVMLAMAVTAPATFQAANNLDFLNIYSIWLYYGFLLIFAFLLLAIIRLIWGKLLSTYDTAITVSLYMFCLILNPSIQGHLKRYGSPTLLFAVLFVLGIIWGASKKRNTKNTAIFFTVLTLIAPFNLLAEAEHEKVYIPDPEEGISLVNIREENRESVFLLVYDAMPDLRTLENLNVNPGPLRKILRDNNFKIYENTYSFDFESVASMSKTFNIMRDSAKFDSMRDMCAGNSRVFNIFKKNSYGTYNIQKHYITGGKSFTDDSFPRGQRYDLSTRNALLSILLTGIFSGEFRFDIAGIGGYSDHDFHEHLRNDAALKNGPWFTAMHVTLPGHSQNSGKLLPNETELFIGRYNAILSEISKDIETILSNKPDSIVIAIGDHGPQLTGDGYMLTGYSFEEITELMIRDRFGTLVAIRWPDAARAAKYDSDLVANQDIFPVVFAYLADSPEPLGLMIKDKKVTFKGRVFLDNGVWTGGR